MFEKGDLVLWTGVLNDLDERSYAGSVLRLTSVNKERYDSIIVSSPERPERVGGALRGKIGNLGPITNKQAGRLLKKE
jgi:hypothetical protein